MKEKENKRRDENGDLKRNIFCARTNNIAGYSDLGKNYRVEELPTTFKSIKKYGQAPKAVGWGSKKEI